MSVTRTPRLSHFLRQAGFDTAQSVLHLRAGGVEVGAGLERDA